MEFVHLIIGISILPITIVRRHCGYALAGDARARPEGRAGKWIGRPQIPEISKLGLQ
jgi:hypothetical protein